MPLKDLPGPVREGNGGRKARHQGFDLGVVENDGVGAVAEALLDYGGPQYETVFIFEFRDGRIAKETAYWSEAFEAPGWRAQWVEKA